VPETNQDGMVKIFFEPPTDPPDDWHTEVESMFATPINQPDAPDGFVYRLENSPWYVFGVSWQDDVCGELRHEILSKGEDRWEGDVLYFTKIWKHNGHSTYTLFLQGGRTTESPEWAAAWMNISKLGCTYESMNRKLVAVDVEPGSDLDAIESAFQDALVADIFAWQTQHRYTGE
jgi:hypothetical protein